MPLGTPGSDFRRWFPVRGRLRNWAALGNRRSVIGSQDPKASMAWPTSAPRPVFRTLQQCSRGCASFSLSVGQACLHLLLRDIKPVGESFFPQSSDSICGPRLRLLFLETRASFSLLEARCDLETGRARQTVCNAARHASRRVGRGQPMWRRKLQAMGLVGGHGVSVMDCFCVQPSMRPLPAGQPKHLPPPVS